MSASISSGRFTSGTPSPVSSRMSARRGYLSGSSRWAFHIFTTSPGRGCASASCPSISIPGQALWIRFPGWIFPS